jgi:FixJ family two-component response regulator
MVIESMGMQVFAYSSAEAFLDAYQEAPDAPACMVLDVRMPGLSGLGLQQMLAAEQSSLPIIMISGCADIPMAVKAMRAGAVDFLEKPVSSQALSTRIREAIDRCVRQQRDSHRKTELARHVDRLSARQREVLDLLVVGERSKQIARQLGIGEKTVAKHRASVLEKLEVDNVVELVRLFADSKFVPQEESTSIV